MYPQQSNGNKESIVIPLFEVVIYPHSRTKFLIDRNTGAKLLTEMKNGEPIHAIGLTVKSDKQPPDLSEDDLYRTGNLFHITSLQPADEEYLIHVKAIQRVEASSLHLKDGSFYANYEPVPDIHDLDENFQENILADVKKTIHDISSRFQSSEELTGPIADMDSIDQIMGYVMPFMPLQIAEKQELLEIVSLRKRYLTFLYILTKQKENINLQIEVAKKVAEKVNKSHREAMLREQLKIIQDELNDNEGSVSGEEGYRERIESSKMPDEVKKKAFAELKKLENSGGHNPETPVIRNYLDLLLDLPWVIDEKKNIDINEARNVLESNHNGLEKVKERIIQHLAVMKLKHEKQGSILLF
ncbi:MAG: LON peptidase substrate-binding domain-containing protein, partial [Methanomethylovorans sp.]|nr:LON peptidase substrate-binding domain-containing protein [Methanomethylovorans sp.]